MSSYTTILWDMDGVLMDSEPQHYRAWKRTLFELFGATELPWDLYKPCIGARYERLSGILRENYGLDIEPQSVRSYYQETLRKLEEEEGYFLTEGMIEVLQALRARGYKMAIASSSPVSAIERFTEATGITGYFDLLFSGEAVKHSKPAPDTFLEAAKRLHSAPEACIVVEDSENGAKAAKAANMACIGYVNPGSGTQDLSAADRLISDMRTLPSILL